jgi:cytochrome b involved in lipid metabolism
MQEENQPEETSQKTESKTSSKNIFVIIAIGILLLIVFAVFFGQSQKPSSLTQQSETEVSETATESGDEQMKKTFSIEEVSLHNSETDCWLAIHGKVYDATEFIPSHPGGEALLQGCGQDATELFETRPMGSQTPHSQKARDFLPNFYIGDLTQ